MLLPAGTCSSLCLSIGSCTPARFHHPCILSTWSRSRTGTGLTARGILSPLRLPISPSRHFKELKDANQTGNLFFVIPTGFEPVTYCLEGSCSIQLSYETICLFVHYKCIIIPRIKKIFEIIFLFPLNSLCKA